MKRLPIFLLGILLMPALHAQYWFGPRVGLQRTDFIYQDSEYKKDSFNVSNHFGGQYGLMVIYQASEKYAVSGELFYEQISKKVTNKEDDEIPIYSQTSFRYLSLPFSLRWNFGKEPVFFYVAGGPKLSYWLGGSGEILLDEFNQSKTIEDPIPYSVKFKREKGGDFDRRAVVEANRVQYGLQVSTGMYFDVVSGGRILVDLRYAFGHSNMAFNGNTDYTYSEYEENFEFRNYTLSATIAYLFEYDVALQRKGSSTNRNSKKIKK
jgi:hypothetical protein